MPKKLIRGFKTTQAWFWRPMFLQNVQDAKNKIKKQQKINFNGAITKEFTPKDLKILTQDLDSVMEK